jgi:hypothetical protein
MAALVNDQDLLIELYDTARPSRPWTPRPASADRKVFAAGLDSVPSCAPEGLARGDRFSSVRCAPSTDGLAFDWRAFGRCMGDRHRRLEGDQAVGHSSEGRQDVGDRLALLRSSVPDPRWGCRQLFCRSVSVSAPGAGFHFCRAVSLRKEPGCIAVVTANPNGTVYAPQRVLEEPHHLSYPFVFEQDGQIWMIPESGAARNVSLYRAVEFPHRWTRELGHSRKMDTGPRRLLPIRSRPPPQPDRRYGCTSTAASDIGFGADHLAVKPSASAWLAATDSADSRFRPRRVLQIRCQMWVIERWATRLRGHDGPQGIARYGFVIFYHFSPRRSRRRGEAKQLNHSINSSSFKPSGTLCPHGRAACSSNTVSAPASHKKVGSHKMRNG